MDPIGINGHGDARERHVGELAALQAGIDDGALFKTVECVISILRLSSMHWSGSKSVLDKAAQLDKAMELK